MANSLLDFVMSVVRDPDAAAAYAANPAQAIAGANLIDVTSVDVDNLIPVVAESMSAAVPSSGFSGGVDSLGDTAPNVWASGAATAAFDAFDDHLPVQGGDVIADHALTAVNVIDDGAVAAPTIDTVIHDVPSVASFDQLVTAAPAFEEHAPDTGAVDDVDHAVDAVDSAHHVLADQLEHPQEPAFDMFT